LAGCADPSELWKRQSDFAQASWDSYAKESSILLDLTTKLGTARKATTG
jgi:hypothetical protein